MKQKISDYKDLIAWQFADELADVVDVLADAGGAARNRKFREQILDSSAKAPAQIAEGFLRFKLRESAYYYRIARASLGETMNHLRRGFRRKYWSETEFAKAWKLAESAMNTTGGLLAAKLAQIAKEDRDKEEKRRTRRPTSSPREATPVADRAHPTPIPATRSESDARRKPVPDRERRD